jgi:PAS domain S-box-containing protein
MHWPTGTFRKEHAWSLPKSNSQATTAQYAARFASIAAFYFVAAIAGLAVPFTTYNISPIWPAAGVAVACLLVEGWQYWPAITIAAFLANIVVPLSPLAALGLAVGNTAAALAATFLLRGIPAFDTSLCRLRDVLGLIGFAAALASTISASFGTIVLGLLGIAPWASLGRIWLVYYVGDATGILLITPLLLSLQEWAQLRSPRRLLEFLSLLVLVTTTRLLLFDEHLEFAGHHTVLALLVFPFVLWAAIRFGISGAAMVSALIAIIAIVDTARGLGPFSKNGWTTNALLLQFFLITMSVSGLLLAAVIAEREKLVRKQAAQEAARKSEERYRVIVELAYEGIWTLDSSGRTTFVNRQFAQMLGYDPEEMLGKNASQFCPETCFPPTVQAGEYRLRRKDGTDLWGALSATSIPDEQHGDQGTLIMLTDITERKRAEEQLRKSTREMKAILDSSPALVYMKDEAGRYLFVNRYWTDFFHVSTEEIQGKTDFELFSAEAASQFAANDQKVIESGKTLDFEESAVFGGQLRSYHSVKVALRHSDGRFYALCGISTDITERKAKEESLRQVHRALRVLSHCNSAVVHATDEQALLREVCRVAVGPAGYQMAWVGYAQDDEARTVRPVASAGLAAWILDRVHVSWADNEYGRGSIGPAIRTGKPVVVRNIQQQPGFAPWREALETFSYQSVLAVPFRLDDNVYGALGVYAAEPEAFNPDEVDLIAQLGNDLAHGISSLRAHKQLSAALAALECSRLELEERVRERTAELVDAKNAAESADRLKSAFLATMSHELRTPLNAIIGFTGIIMQGLAGPLNQEQSKQLGMVQNSARHLLELINDVLDISKIEAGQLEISRESFSMPEAIQKTAATILPLAQAKGLELRTTISAEVGGIYSDRRRTEQVLLNLLGNAVKFTDQGAVTLDCRRENGWYVTSIQDSGIGIDSQQQRDLFKPFHQIDSGLTRKREGTGLGLSISKRLLDLMGGSIVVESIPGKGSTFTVRLPVAMGEIP